MMAKKTRFTDILEAFLMLLVLLPMVDLVDQHRDGRESLGNSGKGKPSGTVAMVAGHNFGGGGISGEEGRRLLLDSNNQTRIAGEMRDEQRRGMGTTRTATGNWNSLSPTSSQQQHQHQFVISNGDMTDRSGGGGVGATSSGAGSLQSVAFPNAFEMYPGLSSSASASESASDEEEFEEEERIIIPKPKPTKQQRHHQHHSQMANNALHQHSPTSAAEALMRLPSSTIGVGGGGGSSEAARSAHLPHHSRQRGGSNSNQVVFLVEPPLPLASSTRVTGPYFDSNKTTLHISAKAGQNVILDCAVILLQGRTVSWLRRKSDSLHLLTVGNATYNSDSRLGLRFWYPNNWRLGIDSVMKEDEGEYQCQLSTHPPRTLIYHLKVIAPVVVILDENGHSVTERHYKVDSSLHLTCRASHVDKFADKVVWLKGERALSGTDNRIKIKVTKTEEVGETSVYLSLLSLRKGDSGNYSCRAGSLAKYTVTVHVVNGELPAAVQHESGATRLLLSLPALWFTLLLSASTTATTTILFSTMAMSPLLTLSSVLLAT